MGITIRKLKSKRRGGIFTRRKHDDYFMTDSEYMVECWAADHQEELNLITTVMGSFGLTCREAADAFDAFVRVGSSGIRFDTDD